MKEASVHSLQPVWWTLMKRLGIRPASVLQRAGLPGDILKPPAASLTSAQYSALWRGLEEESGDPALPIRFGRALTLEVFDAPLFVALSCPHLRAAFQRLNGFERLIAPIAMHLSEKSAHLSMEVEFLDKHGRPPQSLAAANMVYLVQLARLATRKPVCPLKVTAMQPFEPAADFAEYFGRPVERGPAHRLIFSARDAARPIRTTDHGLWRFFPPELRKRLSDKDGQAAISARVRAVLLELLPGGTASLRSVSRKLALSPRTLQRRLSDESTTFRRVLSATREELARHYLCGSALSGTEISFLLGYEDPNSLFRAFHSWTGQTPEEMRRDSRLRAEKGRQAADEEDCSENQR